MHASLVYIVRLVLVINSFSYGGEERSKNVVVVVGVCFSYHIISQSLASSSAVCRRSRPLSSLVRGQQLTMWDIV